MKVTVIVRDKSPEEKKRLAKLRQSRGLYSIAELSEKLGISKAKISEAINSGKVEYISPNRKTRYVFLNEFLEYMKSQKK